MLIRRLAFALLACTVLMNAAACSTTSSANRAVPPLQVFFDDLHARGLFDGAVVVGQRDRIVWDGAYGLANAERDVHFTVDTPSDGASLAKTFTASIVLMLEHDGILDLDAPVQRLLPELPYPEITLRHLLSHSSGLPVLDYDFFDDDLPPGELRTTERLVAVLGARKPPLAFTPGTAFEYSSFGYDLAALAAARAAKTTFGDLLQRRIFDPLDISAFLRPGRLSDFPGVRTIGYRRGGQKLEPNEVFDFEAFHGGSNIYLSARDLHRWNASFLTHPVMDPATLSRSLAAARVAGSPSGLTLGNWYASSDRTQFWYSGHLQGFHSEAFRDTRSQTSIVYVSNNTIEPWLQKGIIRAVRSILAGHPGPTLQPRATVEVLSTDRSSLADRWQLEDGETFRIERDEKTLRVALNGVRYRMIPIDPRTFYVPGIDWMIAFARDAAGNLTRIRIDTNVDERWGTRR